MDEETAKEKILAWCRTQKRSVGMRTFGAAMVVCYLGTMKNVYLHSEYGVKIPGSNNDFNPEVVLASGSTWNEVAIALNIV